MILIGNKADRTDERMVTHGEGESLAKEFKIKFFETSAVENLKVEEAFLNIGQYIMMNPMSHT